MTKGIFTAAIVLFALITARAQGNKAVYGELGGNGLVFSANYDMRFKKAENGFGFRAGVGFAASSGITVFTFPLGLNYLTGKGPHHLEIGFGVTPLTATLDFLNSKSTNGTIFFFPTAGYRYGKIGKGFVGRIYVGPIIAGGNFFFPFGGLSAGVKF